RRGGPDLEGDGGRFDMPFRLTTAPCGQSSVGERAAHLKYTRPASSVYRRRSSHDMRGAPSPPAAPSTEGERTPVNNGKPALARPETPESRPAVDVADVVCQF